MQVCTYYDVCVARRIHVCAETAKKRQQAMIVEHCHWWEGATALTTHIILEERP